jgi:hypothetical protein
MPGAVSLSTTYLSSLSHIGAGAVPLKRSEADESETRNGKKSNAPQSADFTQTSLIRPVVAARDRF